MAGLVAEVIIWTAKNQVSISNDDLSCHSYREKDNSAASVGSQYAKERRHYFESRGRIWSLTNKRPEKLRDGFREYEDLLQKSACISCRWLSPDVLLMVLENGCILRVELASEYADVSRIVVDSSLLGKLTVGTASDVLLTDRYVAFVSSEKTRMDVFYFSKNADVAPRKFDRFSSLEPVLRHIDLPGRAGRALQRRLSVSADSSYVLVWWPTCGTEAWPWAPVPSEAESANMAVVRLTEFQTEVCYSRTDNEPLLAIFSQRNSMHVFTVEKLVSSKASSSTAATARVELCTYELTSSRLHRTAHTRVSLRGGACCAAWNPSETRLALVSEEKHCVVCDEAGEVLVQSVLEVLPVKVIWHPTGSLAIFVSSQGDIQVLDSSLNTLGIYLISSGEDMSGLGVLHLSAYFRPDVRVQHVSWCVHNGNYLSTTSADTFIVVFESGPACLVRLTGGHAGGDRCVSHRSLVAQHLKYGHVTQAVDLLNSMSWQEDAGACCRCLSTIFNYLFKLPLDRDVEALIEAALGSFYAPQQKPLPDVVVLEYRDSIGRLARRFFHHLLRYCRYDKAFLLAVDIGSRDLFMDIYHSARDKGDIELASVAREKASQCRGGLFGLGADVSSDDGISTDDSADDSSTSSSTSASVSAQRAASAAAMPFISALRQPSPPPPAGLADASGLDGFPGYMPSHKVASRQPSTDSMRGPAPPLPPRRGKVPPPLQQQTSPPVPLRAGLEPSGSAPGQQQQPPAQEATAQPGGGVRAHHNRHGPGITLPGYSYETDADLTNQLLDDYMALMVDDPLAFRPKDQQAATKIGSDGSQQAVKVIHFGVV